MITPTDPRHGTPRGYRAGCKEPCCTTASYRYEKQLAIEHAAGRYRKVPAVGTMRRLRALAAIGWTWHELAERMSSQERYVQVLAGGRVRILVLRSTAEKVAAIYDELSMTVPEGAAALRRRRSAARNGWPPPLAYDDDTIDDPAAGPDLGGKTPGVNASRAIHPDSIEWMINTGCTDLEVVAARTGATPKAILRALQRTDRRELSEKITGQHLATRGVAA